MKAPRSDGFTLPFRASSYKKALPSTTTLEEPPEQWRSVSLKSRDVGEVDIVVNNAGYFPNRSIDDLDLATWRKTFATNFGCAFSEREILLAWNEEEEVGPLRWRIVKHRRSRHIGNEPLYRVKDGNHRSS